MSLKRRNAIALILILLAAACWTLGRQFLDTNTEGDITSTTHPGIEETMYNPYDNWITSTIPTNTIPTAPKQLEDDTESNAHWERLLGFFFSFTAVAAGIIAVFVLTQKNPILGPDGICMLGGLSFFAYDRLQNMDSIMWSYIYDRFVIVATILSTFIILLCVREVWGWIVARFPAAWCLVKRCFISSKRPQFSLLFSAAWIAAAASSLAYLLFTRSFRYAFVPVCCFSGAALFGILQLWRYGADLYHFKSQLDNFRKGAPIKVKNGAFSQTESQLLDVQAQHEEAVRTAVTSERFKVELISNVSHDLRTPLTSILGYSELLQNEALSLDGQEQLRRLHQKAGYMNDLVEALFELTKVSSGVVESKQEQIDLVCLLEQTIGLFDDQLASTGLTVRRSYCADTIPVITDGARMHQVFANLLGNAIKYAMAGTRIFLEVKETECRYLVRMMNTASYEMDFKPDEIMQRFARGDKARSTKGSGLGLAIAQTYTASVGGSFRVDVDGDQFSAIVELPKIERNL